MNFIDPIQEGERADAAEVAMQRKRQEVLHALSNKPESLYWVADIMTKILTVADVAAKEIDGTYSSEHFAKRAQDERDAAWRAWLALTMTAAGRDFTLLVADKVAADRRLW